MTLPSDDVDRLPRDYADFYRATAARTFTAARRVAGGDEHIARDATQEAYVSMWRCWEKWANRSIRDAGHYVVKVAFNKVADAFRRKVDVPWPEDFEPTKHEAGYDEILSRSLRRSLLELIDRQPPRRRAVAMLFFIEGCDYSEIAGALQITESTVRTQVERMRALVTPLVDEDNTRGGERS
jgi:RNA polymerase sigma factor (sigma-70 family)